MRFFVYSHKNNIKNFLYYFSNILIELLRSKTTMMTKRCHSKFMKNLITHVFFFHFPHSFFMRVFRKMSQQKLNLFWNQKLIQPKTVQVFFLFKPAINICFKCVDNQNLLHLHWRYWCHRTCEKLKVKQPTKTEKKLTQWLYKKLLNIDKKTDVWEKNSEQNER